MERSAVIKDAAIVFAILIGGVWTLYTFRSLKERRSVELNQRELERKLLQQALVDVEIEASQQTIPNDATRYVEVLVKLRNEGNRDLRIDFGEYVLAVAKVAFDERGKMELSDIEHYPYIVLWGDGEDTCPRHYPYHVLEARTTICIPFFFQVNSDGAYYVQFSAPFSPAEPEASTFPTQAGADPNHGIGIQCHKYVIVK